METSHKIKGKYEWVFLAGQERVVAWPELFKHGLAGKWELPDIDLFMYVSYMSACCQAVEGADMKAWYFTQYFTRWLLKTWGSGGA